MTTLNRLDEAKGLLNTQMSNLDSTRNDLVSLSKAAQDIDWEDEGYEEVNNGNIRSIKALNAKTETIKAAIQVSKDQIQHLEDQHKREVTPVMPADLPMPDSGNNGYGNKSADSLTSPEKSFNIIKYGTPDKELQAVITDTYGSIGNYNKSRQDQNLAFALYMAGPAHHGKINVKGYETLRGEGIAPTPDDFMQALLSSGSLSEINQNAKSASSIGYNVDSGFLIPPDYQQQIISRTPSENIIRGLANVRPTQREFVMQPRRTGGDDQFTGNVRISWINDLPPTGSAKTNATYDLVKISVEKMGALLTLSKDMMDDSPINVANEVIKELREAVQITEGNVFTTGNGVGKPEGILPSGTSVAKDVAVVKWSIGGGTPGVEKSLFKAIVNLEFAIQGRYTTNACYLANRQTFNALATELAGDGHFLWTERYGNNAVGVPNALRGFKWMEQQSIFPLAIGNFAIIFGDLSGYTIADRKAMSIKIYDVKPIEGIIEYEMFHRIGGQVVQPWKFAALEVVA